jgi:ankyrin repeat protein
MKDYNQNALIVKDPIISVIEQNDISTTEKLCCIQKLIKQGSSPFIKPIALDIELAEFFSKFRPTSEIFIKKSNSFIQDAKAGYKIVYEAKCQDKNELDQIIQEVENNKLNIDNIFYGETLFPLLNASIMLNDNELLAKLLHDLNANPDQCDMRGRTPLTIAIGVQNTQAINLLLQHNSDINLAVVSQDNKEFLQLLEYGASICCSIKDKDFIEHALNLDYVDKIIDRKGQSILISVFNAVNYSEDEKLEITKKVLEKNYELHKNPKYEILKYAIQKHYFSIADLLLEKGADISTISGKYVTYLIERKVYDLAHKLILSGVSTSDINDKHLKMTILDKQHELANIICIKFTSELHKIPFHIQQDSDPKNHTLIEYLFMQIEILEKEQKTLKTLIASPVDRIDHSNEISFTSSLMGITRNYESEEKHQEPN